MGWLDAKTSLLRQHSLHDAHKLGDGEEAEVYALGPDRVLRLCRENASRGYINRRRAFYASLDRTQVPFEVPTLLEEGEHDGVHYVIEGRLAGISLAAALLVLEGSARHCALTHYAETAAQVSKLLYQQNEFGEVLTDTPLRAETWSEFVLCRAEASLAASHTQLIGEVDHPERALAELERRLTRADRVRPVLVHGDYHPGNVMVGEDGQITGMLDFGWLTLMGDAEMDRASAVLYLTGMAGVSMDDKQFVLRCLQQQGFSESSLALYRLFFAFRFLDTTRAGLFRWCIETIRSCC